MKVLATSNALACLAGGGTALAQNAKNQDSDLRLFGKAQVDRRRACAVALRQANRDPDRDNFAYVFVEALDSNPARRPARVKIGQDVLRLRRVATGGQESGYKLFAYQLYRTEAEHGFVVLELKLVDSEGKAAEVESGSLNVCRPGKLPMRVSVKDGAGCHSDDATPKAAAWISIAIVTASASASAACGGVRAVPR